MSAVLYEKRDRIAFITLNRPEVLNAFNREMHQGLREVWQDFRQDDDVWVALVTGAGDRSFSSGQDVKELGERQADRARRSFWETWFGDNLQTGLDVWKPVVAAINGYCIGEGLTLSLSCDLRVASDRASFGFPEVQIGVPTIVGALRAPRVVGMGNALELLLLGERVDAQRALQMGLVNRVVAHDSLMAEATAWAERLARNGPLAVRATKEAASRGQQLPFADAVRLGESLRRLATAGEDAREGPQAFLEKREPRFTGK
jgi:enoyl-CoA hydratase/carnithine racemase